jgi:hypothetical protein
LPATVDPTGIAASGYITITGLVQRGMLEVPCGKSYWTVVHADGKSHRMIPDCRIMEPDDAIRTPSSPAQTDQTFEMDSIGQFTSGLHDDKKQDVNTIGVTLLAICNEHQEEMQTHGLGLDTLFCLVLKVRDGDISDMKTTGGATSGSA